MAKILQNLPPKRFIKSKRALALPVTFLILLVSTLAIITVAYYFAVANINTQSKNLKVSTAQQDFLNLDNSILSTLGQPGSSSTIRLSDSGGTTNIEPGSNLLTVNVNDNSGIDETIFNSPVGQVSYELPISGSIQTGLYLDGDSQSITNRSGALPSQLFITNGAHGPLIQLQYRPTVTYSSSGSENGQTINDVRIYIVNLNSSDPINLEGALPLIITCTNTQLSTITYQVSQQTNTLTINSQLNGSSGNVSIPISRTTTGAIIHIEIVISNVSIDRWIT